MKNSSKRIICFGDSLVFGYGVNRCERWQYILDEECENVEFVNRGKNHDNTYGMLERFEKQVLNSACSSVIIFGGSNDIFQKLPTKKAAENLFYMCDKASSSGIKTYISTISPYLYPYTTPVFEYEVDFVYAQAERVYLNDIIRDYTKDSNNDVVVIDTASMFESFDKNTLFSLYVDEIHQSPKGHRLIADLVRQTVKIS